MRFYHFILVDTTQVEGALYVSLYIEYHVLFSYSSGGMWYLDLLEMVFTLWHCITLHCMAFGVMSRTYGCDRTGTASS